ncbi:hypothetical protein GUITHDRAFT_105125 [Guillardia theta CCMP2712]|uniref:Uncharacterized protein n=1 Tax=Guillardia theta (strain CCMP2712) TaxID=905079 RepID=L1JLJ9_GUITC|nr:hypothetical protein GUITHDRAFT_105125 [Guillardia theta CCMP2712]EKX49044.1 hypothetical protein GUITHDRAFT_105125 [Guillardia theta CCMP2712]|eukprot:XP_005836024.1 hypothetical protein GUITHDRAFT_105125 [Guillardia theta CCMP2712]
MQNLMSCERALQLGYFPETLVVNFDQLHRQVSANQRGQSQEDVPEWNEEEREAWKSARHLAFQRVEERLRDNPEVLILVDDNLYLRSMRYYFCKIARKHHASTCTLWVSCDVDLALRRNAAREVQDRVPPAVVERMFDKFEEPGYTPSSKSSWEKHAAKVCTDASFTIPWDLIIEAFKHPHTAEEVNPDAELQAEEDRKRTRENQTHRLDLELRKVPNLDGLPSVRSVSLN